MNWPEQRPTTWVINYNRCEKYVACCWNKSFQLNPVYFEEVVHEAHTKTPSQPFWVDNATQEKNRYQTSPNVRAMRGAEKARENGKDVTYRFQPF